MTIGDYENPVHLDNARHVRWQPRIPTIVSFRMLSMVIPVRPQFCCQSHGAEIVFDSSHYHVSDMCSNQRSDRLRGNDPSKLAQNADVGSE